MWPGVQIQDFQSMAHIPLSALSSPQTHPSRMVIQLLCNCFHWSIFSIHLKIHVLLTGKKLIAPPPLFHTVPFYSSVLFSYRVPIFLLLLLFLELSSTVSFLIRDTLVSTVMLSHVITFTFLYPVYSQSLISLSPGVFPLSLLTNRFSVVGVTPPPSVLHLYPLLPLQQQSYQTPSRQVLLQSCQTLTVDTTSNKVSCEAVTCQLPEDDNRIFTMDIKPRSPHSAIAWVFSTAWRKRTWNSLWSLQQAYGLFGSVPLHFCSSFYSVYHSVNTGKKFITNFVKTQTKIIQTILWTCPSHFGWGHQHKWEIRLICMTFSSVCGQHPKMIRVDGSAHVFCSQRTVPNFFLLRRTGNTWPISTHYTSIASPSSQRHRSLNPPHYPYCKRRTE